MFGYELIELSDKLVELKKSNQKNDENKLDLNFDKKEISNFKKQKEISNKAYKNLKLEQNDYLCAIDGLKLKNCDLYCFKKNIDNIPYF